MHEPTIGDQALTGHVRRQRRRQEYRASPGLDGVPETPEWQAQTAFAREAVSKTAEESPRASLATDQRMETLREFVLKGYQTMKMAAR